MLPPEIKSTVSKNLKSMTREDCIEWLENRSKEKPGIGSELVKKITGGYSSQSIDFEICQMIGKKIRGGSRF